MHFNSFFIFLFFLFAFNLNAQFYSDHFIVAEDTITKKSHIKSFIATLAIDGSIWAIDRYIGKTDFSIICTESIRKNFHCGFRWDNDGFETNMFDHPAHGSFNFNSCNYNGLNYWESLPYSVLSSLVWEMFLENEPPSVNDLLSSTIGGLALGETTGRIGQILRTPYQRGLKRIGSETLNFLITPSVSLQRMINGEMWEIKKNANIIQIPADIQIGAGLDYFADNKLAGKDAYKVAISFNVNYNDPFKLKKIKPFDHFKLKTRLNILGNQPIRNKLNIEAVIYGKKIDLPDENKIFIGIFQHYNYYNTDTVTVRDPAIPYQIAAPASYGLGLLHNNVSNNIDFNTEVYVSAVLIGAGKTDHYNVKKRNYNLGAGYSGKIHTSAIIKDKAKFGLDLEYYRLFTWKGIPQDMVITDENLFSFQGDRGNAIHILVNPGLQITLFKKLSLGIEMLYYSRKNQYFYYNDVKKSSTELTGNLLYNF
jgi:hypothetical protein